MVDGAIDVCNFDASWSGGPTEWRRVAAMALAFDVAMGHHEEPQVGRHLLASIPHGTFVECFHPDRDPIWWNLVANRPPLVDGRHQLTAAPGLGWELDRDYIDRYRVARRLMEDGRTAERPGIREVARARGRGDVVRLARAVRPPRREPGDARARDGGGRRARLPARHARPEPAPAVDEHVGFVVGDISNPLLAEIALGAERRCGGRLLDAAHELRERPGARRRARAAAAAAARRRATALAGRRGPSRDDRRWRTRRRSC